MADSDQPKMFRTLRGFLNGEEPDEANYFRFSAMLRIHGDEAGARVAYERVIDSGHGDWAPAAFINLLSLLRKSHDLDSARVAYRTAIETRNPEAPYALLVIGQILRTRGDIEGAQTAFEQALAAGYKDAEEMLQEINRAE